MSARRGIRGRSSNGTSCPDWSYQLSGSTDRCSRADPSYQLSIKRQLHHAILRAAGRVAQQQPVVAGSALWQSQTAAAAAAAPTHQELAQAAKQVKTSHMRGAGAFPLGSPHIEKRGWASGVRHVGAPPSLQQAATQIRVDEAVWWLEPRDDQGFTSKASLLLQPAAAGCACSGKGGIFFHRGI